MNKKRILLVDDEKSLTTLLKLNLEETGQYEVRVENFPEDALATAREFIMPRLPGGNVAVQFKSDPQLQSTPIVFLTAAVRRHQVEDHDGIICEHPCLAKPSSLEEVIGMIEKHARVR
jgi:CheY-like chemotaxis protein